MADSQGTVDKQVFGMDLKVLGGFAALVFVGAQQFEAIKGRITRLEEAPQKVQQIDERLRDTDSTVKSLKDGFEAMNRASADMQKKVERIDGDVSYIRQQITILTAESRGGQSQRSER